MSEAIAFDTHRFVKNLTESGFTEKQAEALANEQVHLLNSNLATKADIMAVKADIMAVKADIQTTNARIETVHAGLKADIQAANARIETVHAGLKADIQAAKVDLLKWIVTAIIAQAGLVVALIKLL